MSDRRARPAATPGGMRATLLAALALAAAGHAGPAEPSALAQVLRLSGESLDRLGPARPDEAAEEAGTPVVMMHGMGDFAENPMGMGPVRRLVARETGAHVHSAELCSRPEQLSDCPTEDQSNGFLMTMDDQVDQFARVVRSDPKLARGFNAIGFSQGSLVVRGYIHRYNEPPVRTFLSVHGVLMGVAGLPQCPEDIVGLGLVCRAVARLAGFGCYTQFVQERLAQANYYRDPENLDSYRSEAHFLPYVNNEVQGKQNATYKANFASLERLVLVMAEDDTMVHPKESEHFGYLADGSQESVVRMREAPWYAEDWFGLRTLDVAGKVDLYSTPGNHLKVTDAFLVDMLHKYFRAPPDAESLPVVV